MTDSARVRVEQTKSSEMARWGAPIAGAKQKRGEKEGEFSSGNLRSPIYRAPYKMENISQGGPLRNQIPEDPWA
jgi:hypothetical protein